MGANTFGKVFQIMTWGESHGKALGVIIDGCPAGLELSEADIEQELALRRPGMSPYTSPRKEKDTPQILSGVFEGKTTGAPISIIIYNNDCDSSKYDPIKHLLRPGHANFTYLEKYGIFDHRGGGRSSGRETVCRVAAGAVAKKYLALHNITVRSYMHEIAGVKGTSALELAIEEGDSVGGVVETEVLNMTTGLGDPIYEKLEANLAKAMLSIPASKGFEIGSGFESARMKGSEHNDCFAIENGTVVTTTNHAGGTLGGISTGMPLNFRVAFKPTSSIKKAQETVSIEKTAEVFQLPEGSRHDPCVALRAVPVVEAMTALVLADALLMNRLSKIGAF